MDKWVWFRQDGQVGVFETRWTSVCGLDRMDKWVWLRQDGQMGVVKTEWTSGCG